MIDARIVGFSCFSKWRPAAILNFKIVYFYDYYAFLLRSSLFLSNSYSFEYKIERLTSQLIFFSFLRQSNMAAGSHLEF